METTVAPMGWRTARVRLFVVVTLLINVSLKDDLLLVKVQFPCAANRRCSMKRCCPISEMIDPWTTVTVYNMLNRSEYQMILTDVFSNISLIKALVHDPVSLVPLSLVPVDPCDIRVEINDHISESSSSLPSDQASICGSTYPCDLLQHDSSSGGVYWDSGGIELKPGLESGVSIPPVAHSSKETCGTNGD
ncbi:hypothetical protein EXN66_Car013510 [Channa argus]|uniref:Uncharacterized protein n=1 Tax=Channa argus TaxID=215402 RepID=A0A6G1Q5X6_CHAAH|nr:hypothetical protein EXN66_Car013510 [Channa argus]